jgi:bifunctional DNase/RNase
MLIEMQIKGLMMDPVTGVPIVILRNADNQRVLPIWVGPVEANAIALQIENVTPPRPMTHDLLKNLLTEFDARVQRVVISALRGQHVLRLPRHRSAGHPHPDRRAAKRRSGGCAAVPRACLRR